MIPGGTVPGTIAALEQAARIVRDELRRDGRPLTRDALANQLRAAGHPVRNARLTPILAALQAEPGNHAKRLKARVRNCPHAGESDD